MKVETKVGLLFIFAIVLIGAFAWQLGAGVGVKVAERTTLDLGYRYLKPNSFDTHGLGDGKLECHNIMLGLRYQF